MTIEFSFHLEGTEKLEMLPNFFEEAGEIALQQALLRIANMVHELATQKVPYATGKLRANLTPALENPRSAIVYSTLEYAPHVHEGYTRSFFDPESLVPWVKSKKREAGRFARNSAWAIVVGTEGDFIEGEPFLAEAVMEAQGFAVGVIESHLREAFRKEFQ